MRRIRSRVPGRAIVRVRACALNHLDLWERRGIERVALPLPHISGSDVAGEVIDAGTRSDRAGTRVMLQPGLRCGACAACRPVATISALDYDVLGLQSDGGYAELISVPGREPDADSRHTSISSTAAAFPLTFLTAWHMLRDPRQSARGRDGARARRRQRRRAGRDSGRAHLGARVLATSAPDKIDRTRALGAEEVFDHYAGDFSREIARAHRRPRRRRRRRARRRSDLGSQRARARNRRTARHLRRDDRATRRARSASPVRAPAVAARFLHGHVCRAARSRATAVRRHVTSRHRQVLPLAEAAEAQRRAGRARASSGRSFCRSAETQVAIGLSGGGTVPATAVQVTDRRSVYTGSSL